MFVNKYRLNINNFNTGTTEQYITVPLNSQFQLVDNDELINRVFVDTEVKNAVNKILDYDRVRFIPLLPNDELVSSINYDLSLLTPNGQYTTNYGGVGYQYDDVKFRKNAFTKSFLRLSFYDSNDPMVQNLVGFTTIFSNLKTIDLVSTGNGNVAGVPKPINDIPINFILQNPLYNKRALAEGFHLYYYKDSLSIGESKFLYMKATFNNAKNGKSINLMVKSEPQSVDKLVNELYVRLIITRTSTGYYYKFDDTYQGNNTLGPNNISFFGPSVNVKLYEVLAL